MTVRSIESTIDTTIIVRHPAQPPSGRMSQFPRRMLSGYPLVGEETVRRLLTLLLSATVQGISSLVASRRITTPQSEALIDDAITLFLAGRLTSGQPAGRTRTR